MTRRRRENVQSFHVQLEKRALFVIFEEDFDIAVINKKEVVVLMKKCNVKNA